MNIGGIQKLTLLDFPGKVAATIFINGCNFRCPFCHNAGLVLPSQIQNGYSEAGVYSFLESRKKKLDGVCITGGEPLASAALPDFIKNIRDMGFLVKLDTNGSFPDKLSKMIDSGLIDYVAMDIKNSKEKYPLTIGLPDFDISPVCESVDLLMNGTIEYEFRTTVVRQFHTEEDIASIGDWIGNAERYFLQSFKDSGNLINGKDLSGYSEEEMQNLLDIAKSHFRNVSLRG